MPRRGDTNDRRNEPSDARRQQDLQHVGLEEIHGQADAGEGPRQSDHAQLIEVIGIVVVGVVVTSMT